MTQDELARALTAIHEESFGWALSLCDWDHAAAEDVLQTTYLRVLSEKATFGGRSTFRTWLFGVIRRVSQEAGRRKTRDRRRHRELSLVEERVAVHGENPVSGVIRSQQSRVLLTALEALPDRQREVLHLVFYEEMSISAAAEVMGVSLGSARTHYERGKKRMRVLLGEKMP